MARGRERGGGGLVTFEALLLGPEDCDILFSSWGSSLPRAGNGYPDVVYIPVSKIQ